MQHPGCRSRPRERRAAIWWDGRSGRLLLDRARDMLPRWIERLQPETILQLGQPVFWGLPPGDEHTWVLLNDGFALPSDEYLQAYGVCEAMPFAAMRFDLVIVPFCLTRMANPQAVLEECWRVLRPEGHVLIMDFNPGGSLSVVRRWHLWRRDRAWPWLRPFLPLGRLRSLLEGQGFVLREGRYFQYTVPGLRRNAQWMELVGDRWWPAGANAYLILAQRRDPERPLVGAVRSFKVRSGRQNVRSEAPVAYAGPDPENTAPCPKKS
ncbi:class I SAM-dependent methyltransferase [Acidithiobacillus sp.]|uniref:class I SAM-dependent methyltransferase n=1 Tax=Acidithiobacillus sp. TaxID=1872118 RepID=UPI003D04D5E7